MQGFVKQMLDVADNLERAASAVPSTALANGESLDVAELQKQLRTLQEGVQMTQQVLNQVRWFKTVCCRRLLLLHLTGHRRAQQLYSAVGLQSQWRSAL